MDSLIHLKAWAQAAATPFPEILPPREVLRRFHKQANEPEVQAEQIGMSELGEPLWAYTFGTGDQTILLYAFPDPGEAVGGTTALALLNLFLKGDAFTRSYHWAVIPCLNPDDQPAAGERLEKVMRKAQVRNVDWCTHEPRRETTALLHFAQRIAPHMTYTSCG